MTDPLPHDIPDYDPSPHWGRVVVRKGPDGRWRCWHDCSVGMWPLAGFFTQRLAFAAAAAHARYHGPEISPPTGTPACRTTS